MRRQTHILRTLATSRPRDAPQSSEGTKRPLGTDTPYVQHASRKYSTKKMDRVTGLKVAAGGEREEEREREREREGETDNQRESDRHTERGREKRKIILH